MRTFIINGRNLGQESSAMYKGQGVNRKDVPDIADSHLSAHTRTRLPGEISFVCSRPIQQTKEPNELLVYN